MSETANVLQLSSTLSMGGAEQLLLGLAKHVDRRRFKLHVCSLGVVRGNALQPDFEQLDLPVQVLGARRAYDPAAIQAIVRYVREQRIDIIHTHLGDADVIGRIVGRALGVPVISTMQNEPRDYNRASLHWRLLERLTARYLSPTLVAVSERIKTLFVREWHVPAERIITIYNAVTMAPFLAVPAHPPQHAIGEGPLITTIGRLSTQKGQCYLIEAARRVLEQRPNTRFLIAGQGRLEQSLREEAERFGVAEHVTFAGLRRDVPALLAQSDVFTLPSLWEGLPLTAIEAMAAARPVVLTDVGGNRELVTHGQNGMIVPPANAEALADTLLDLLDDEERRVAFGQAARERVRHDFSIETVASQYEALYERVLREPRMAGVFPHGERTVKEAGI